MLSLLVVMLVMTNEIEARIFDNPVLNGNYSEPSAVKINGTYYIVTAAINPIISVSKDLVNWEIAGYVFDEGVHPPIYKDEPHRRPEIHKIGDTYKLYYWFMEPFIAAERIMVAVANNVFGPYLEIHNIISGFTDTTVFIDKEHDYPLLIFANRADKIETTNLTSNGENFNGSSVILLESGLAWEGGHISSPSMFKRGEYFYLLYTGGSACNHSRSIGVARATNLLGPYEKRGAPILVSNKIFTEPSYANLVKDVDDESDVIVFHANLRCDQCGTFSTLMASVGWGSDKWPYIFDF